MFVSDNISCGYECAMVSVGVSVLWYVWRSEENYTELVLSFHLYMGRATGIKPRPLGLHA